MLSDKRQFPRYAPRREAFAALGRGITKVGKIKDISKGGSAFEYIIHADLKQKSERELDIFIPGDEFYLADIPCKVIYDFPINRYNTFTAPFIAKRCGITFGLLSEEHLRMLDIFLNKYVHVPAASRKAQHTSTTAAVSSLP